MMYKRYNNKLINKKNYKLIQYFIIIYVGGFSKYILCILFFLKVILLVGYFNLKSIDNNFILIF